MLQRNIQQVRADLSVWGQFWHGREQVKGYGSRSSCDKLSEIRGPSASNAGADSISVPALVLIYDALIENLRPECKRALRAYYVCSKKGVGKTVKSKGDIQRNNWALVGFSDKKEYEFWLRRAEMDLL